MSNLMHGCRQVQANNLISGLLRFRRDLATLSQWETKSSSISAMSTLPTWSRLWNYLSGCTKMRARSTATASVTRSSRAKQPFLRNTPPRSRSPPQSSAVSLSFPLCPSLPAPSLLAPMFALSPRDVSLLLLPAVVRAFRLCGCFRGDGRALPLPSPWQHLEEGGLALVEARRTRRRNREVEEDLALEEGGMETGKGEGSQGCQRGGRKA
mmetsp:Transcript_44227/g.90261  ORF Transcript_44227/g.90261 Transcript_44227/m.90261 type:complete len:210 (-) Transcript_44227:114-743(-)